jgi:hypothetical protein
MAKGGRSARFEGRRTREGHRTPPRRRASPAYGHAAMKSSASGRSRARGEGAQGRPDRIGRGPKRVGKAQ